MNHFRCVIVALLLLHLIKTETVAGPADIEKARQYGARGQVTFRVVDSTLAPVEQAEISVTFWGSDSSPDALVSGGHTDSNGLFVAAGKTIHSMNYTVSKVGYYETRGEYWFYRRGEDCVQDGRWLPWNTTNTVVLNEKRKPIPMYAKKVDTPIPERNNPIGFDLEVGDWVAPYGLGKQADMIFIYKATVQDIWTGAYELTAVCSNRMDGFVRWPKNLTSELRSAYEAPTGGYVTSVVLSLEMTKDKTLVEDLLSEKEYLIFRVRTRLDDEGNVTSAQYGKIYGPLEFGRIGKIEENRGGVRFTYYLNPTPNDRNLEFDPKRNLFTDLEPREKVYEP